MTTVSKFFFILAVFALFYPEAGAVAKTVFSALMIAAGVALWQIENKKVDAMSGDERNEYARVKQRRAEVAQYGSANPQLLCPHCQQRGGVHTKSITQKKGISGGKAVGALLTAGTSMLVTGLSRKEGATEAHCTNCGSTWHF